MFDNEERKYLEEMEERLTVKTEEARHGAVHDMQVIIENTILPQFKLLAEGQQTILETLTPKSKTEELQEEVDFLKSIIKLHTKQLAEQEREIEELKKAQ